VGERIAERLGFRLANGSIIVAHAASYALAGRLAESDKSRAAYLERFYQVKHELPLR
jgi:hypothetical protein